MEYPPLKETGSYATTNAFGASLSNNFINSFSLVLFAIISSWHIALPFEPLPLQKS